MKDHNYLKISQDHLSQGRILDSITTLTGNVNDDSIKTQVLQLEIRYNLLQKRINNGTIDVSDAQLEENRISNSVLLIISNLAKERDVFPTPTPTASSKSFDPKWIIIAFLALGLFALGYYVLRSDKIAEAGPCDKIECLNNGVCNNGKCDCPSGYTGDRCQTKVEIADPCKNINCLNGGICRDGKCNCPSGYKGDRCQTKVEVADPCKNINCLNGGICRDGKCDCPSGYKGDRCQTKIEVADPCKNIICKNGGVCRDGKCDCPSGYTGSRCQTKIDLNAVTDSRDNNKYKIKKIGNTYWTLENMRYNISGSKCNKCTSRGRHYNLSMAKKACPKGWSLPSVKDFQELYKKGGSFDGAEKLAEIKYRGRYGRVSGGNNYSGIGTFASFWTSSTQGGYGSHYFFNKNGKVSRADFQGDDQMYSCRCVKRGH